MVDPAVQLLPLGLSYPEFVLAQPLHSWVTPGKVIFFLSFGALPPKLRNSRELRWSTHWGRCHLGVSVEERSLVLRHAEPSEGLMYVSMKQALYCVAVTSAWFPFECFGK